MGKMDKFMDFLKISDPEIDEEYENEEDYEEYEAEDEVEEKKSFFFFGRKKDAEPEYEDDDEDTEEEAPAPVYNRSNAHRPAPTHSKVVSMNGKGLEMHSIRVIDFKDCQEIAERLGEGKTVVINMEDVKNPAAQRIMDFVSGAVYAYNGTLSAVSQKVFIAAPLQVPVEGDFIDDIMNGDLLSPEMTE